MAGAHRAGRATSARSGARRRASLWLAGGASAVLLTSTASGTFASWTSAVLADDSNDVATARAVVLAESDGLTTCRSSDQPSNAATCAGVNTYGGTASPLMPGQSRTIDLTFTNIGSTAGSTFTMTPGTCTQSPLAGSGTPAATDLCTVIDELRVAVSCSPGTSYSAGGAWSDLVYPAAPPPSAPKIHAAVGADLAAGARWTCRVTVSLAAGASVASQNIGVSQPITWTLAS